MHEPEELGPASDPRLLRVEAALEAQQQQIAALRREVDDLRRNAAPRGPLPLPIAPPSPLRHAPTPQPRPAAAPPDLPLRPMPSAFSSFTEPAAKTQAHRSVENRIGSQLFNRIGIVALLVGVALFLKLAIDNHWIHPTATGRIIAGLLVGAGVVLWSERFRRKGYPAFSFSLKAVGTGTLYLSLWASFQLYHLLPAGVALAAMIGVTAWNAAMAWLQDSELLAVYALVGGFATPELLGSGGNHEIFLFSYLLAMDVAVALLLWKKPWQRLLLGSFPATVVYFIVWYVSFFRPEHAAVTALFVVLLAAPFMAVALLGLQRDDVFEGVAAPLASAAFLALALYSVLQDSGRHNWLPWGAILLAALYLLLMRLRHGGLAEAVHLALAVVFLTIAIPLKAEGRWITIGWLAEGVALLWAAARLLPSDVQARIATLLRVLGCGALALGVAESLVFWIGQNASSAFWNGRFATELAAVAALALAAWIARHAAAGGSGEATAHPRMSWPVIAAAAALTANVIVPLAVARELSAFWSSSSLAESYRSELAALSIAALLAVYGATLLAWVVLHPKRSEAASAPTSLLRELGCLYLVCGWVVLIIEPALSPAYPATALWNGRFFFEVLGAAALAFTVWLSRGTANASAGSREPWITIAAASFVAFNLLAVLAGVHEIVTFYVAGGSGDAGLAQAFTISAWLMLYAAALLAAGFWKRMGFVRWQGLGLLVFTIGKVFVYDVRNLSSIYRVLSFIGLGIVLMGVSFAYQKDWLQLREAPTGDESPSAEAPQ